MPDSYLNEVVHALRTDYLREMPPGARVLLSAGCAGRWYFDWIHAHYGPVAKHYGIEAYSPKPDDLPEYAEWLAEQVDDMRSVETGSVDLVYAGQTVEHLWPRQLAGFLLESRRCLRAGGWLVMDSPNRLITQLTGWCQPQHTAELRVDEIVQLTEMAGFKVERVKGLWLCYDSDRHQLLPLEPANPADRDPAAAWRATAARDNPEDSFIWWLEATPGPNAPRPIAEIESVAQAIYDRAYATATTRWFSNVGRVSGQGRNQLITADVGESGYMLYGPYVPLLPGTYSVNFYIGLTEKARRPVRQAVFIDLASEQGTHTLAGRWVSTLELRPGQMKRFELKFSSREVLFGVEFRVVTSGQAAVVVRAPADLIEHDRWATRKIRPIA